MNADAVRVRVAAIFDKIEEAAHGYHNASLSIVECEIGLLEGLRALAELRKDIEESQENDDATV